MASYWRKIIFRHVAGGLTAGMLKTIAMKPFFFIPFLALIGLSSCGPTLTPFTQDLYRKYDWDDHDLKRIQFYLSEDIRLAREYTGGASEIIAGEITVIEGREMDEVFIPAGTPGVYLFSPKRNRFAISFERDGPDLYLMFGPNPKMGDRYALLASNWSRSAGTVTYGGEKYRVSSRSAYSSLLVDLKKVARESRRSRVAGGRVVDP